jgi:hypothetical protein
MSTLFTNQIQIGLIVNIVHLTRDFFRLHDIIYFVLKYFI